MRKDKEKAFELRKEGKSYRFIQNELGISRSTLCDWFRDVSWSRHLIVANTTRTRTPEHIKKMQAARHKKLEELYKNAEKDAEIEYLKYRSEPLFWAGLMIYGGEGDKRNRNLVRVTNSEFYLHRIFIAFAEKYLGKPKVEIKFCLIIYPDLNESLCREMWSNILGIERNNFHKTQVIQGKDKVKRLQYGIGMSIIPNTVLKRKVMKWLSLSQDERFAPDAVIV